MSKIITEAQKHEIENLAGEHVDALIAYGADMYHEGICDAAKWGIFGVACGIFATFLAKKLYLKHKKSKQQEES